MKLRNNIFNIFQGKLSLASKIHGLAERLQQLGKSSGDSVDGSDKGSRSRTGTYIYIFTKNIMNPSNQ